MLRMFLWRYTDSRQLLSWRAASINTAEAFQRGPHLAHQLRKWGRSFIHDQEDLLFNLYGSWNTSLLDKGKLAKEIHAHLQGIRKYVRALDIVHFLDTPEIKEK
jgi:hypothetical protein